MLGILDIGKEKKLMVSQYIVNNKTSTCNKINLQG